MTDPNLALDTGVPAQASAPGMDDQLLDVLARFPGVLLAVLFGSGAAGRPIDLIDLKVVTEPLLGQIVRHGRRLLGSDDAYGQLISRHLFEQADFMPYRSRVLAERRAAWTGK